MFRTVGGKDRMAPPYKIGAGRWIRRPENGKREKNIPKVYGKKYYTGFTR
jgi:hypothetical protein